MCCEKRSQQTLFQLGIAVRVNTVNNSISSDSQTACEFDTEMNTDLNDKHSLHEHEVVHETEPVVEIERLRPPDTIPPSQDTCIFGRSSLL